MEKPDILFLADITHHTQAVRDHIQAITSDARINWHLVNPLTCKTIDKLDLSSFDAIGVHYSIKPYNHYYLSMGLKKCLAAYTGIKFLFLQDEYQKVNQVQEFMFKLGFHILFTLVKQDMVQLAYPDPRLSALKKVTVLTGYVSDAMKTMTSPPIHRRLIDVSYRGRRCEYWLGSLAHEKEMIAAEFLKRVENTNHKLKLDISTKESARVYGQDWLKLLMSSKAVLGTESGASIWDFDDAIRNKTNHYLRRHKQADFHEVYARVLQPYDGKIMYNAVSPRVFEAAATKTPMIMFPGEYSQVCQPDIHYIVLEKDFSNLADVLKKLKDFDFLQQLADNTYADLIESDLFSQHQFSQLVGTELLSLINSRRKTRSIDGISEQITQTIRRYKHLNRFRCLLTEMTFVGCNFLKLLFDRKHPLSAKVKTLVEGGKRYLAYLLPRMKVENKE